MNLIKYISVLFIATLFNFQVAGQSSADSVMEDNMSSSNEQLLISAQDDIIQSKEESRLIDMASDAYRNQDFKKRDRKSVV